jgi:hypothetical protein
MKRLMLCVLLASQWVIAQDKVQNKVQTFDPEVLSLFNEKLDEETRSLKTYHEVADSLSDAPVGSFKEFFDTKNFKKLPTGVKESVRTIKLIKIFVDDKFPNVSEVNGIWKKYIALQTQVDSECSKAKELIIRKRNKGKVSWAKSENDIKALEEKAWRKKRDAYWKIMEKFFLKYKL